MSANASVNAKTSAWSLLVMGYALATVGLLADLPTIGASGTPAIVSIGVAVLIGIGILLASAGMLQLRRAVDRDRQGARRGLAMQALGLIVLLLGVLALQISSSIADGDQQPNVVEAVLFVSVVFVVSAGALVIAGGLLLSNHHSDISTRSRIDVGYLLLGTVLIFIGVGVILGAKIGYFFVLPDVESTVVEDVGAAVSACGCVVAAYSSFVMGRPSPVSKMQVPGEGFVSRWRPSIRRAFSSRA